MIGVITDNWRTLTDVFAAENGCRSVYQMNVNSLPSSPLVQPAVEDEPSSADEVAENFVALPPTLGDPSEPFDILVEIPQVSGTLYLKFYYNTFTQLELT